MAMTTEEKTDYKNSYRQKNPEKVKAWTRASYHRVKSKYSIDEWRERCRNNYKKMVLKHGKSFREKQRIYSLKQRYGITKDQYEKMILSQNNKCPICDIEFNGNAVVDHCHKTKIVRGLLCRLCNVSLGGLKDKPEILMNAYLYLIKERI